MEDKEGENGKIDNINEEDRMSQVISRVIHEYDVIDEHIETNTSAYQENVTNERKTVLEGDENKNEKDCVSHSQSQTVLDTETFLPSSELTMDTKDSDSSQDDHIEVTYPKVNCPEKIVICLDLSTEMAEVTFRSRAGDKWTPLKLAKRALTFYLYSKNRINKHHQFALVVLQEKAIWVKDFTNNVKDMINLLEDLVAEYTCDSFDISSVFDVVHENVELPQVDGDQSILPPPYVVRLLLIYGRSNCQIEFRQKETFKWLDSSRYFFVDAMYVHVPASEENKCEDIFNRLCDLDEKGTSYIFEAARNPTRLYDQMAQLLAHPLQRPLQIDTAYRLHNVADIAETPQT